MTNRKKSKTIINVGVDVGKQFLDVCIYEKSLHWQEENNTQGIICLLRRLAHYQVERLVMEATGRYEFNLAQAAYEKGIAVCIVKPLSVRRYAGAIDQLAKTDKIDAALIDYMEISSCLWFYFWGKGQLSFIGVLTPQSLVRVLLSVWLIGFVLW